MSNTILLKRSAIANAVPGTGSISLGELAINTYDGRLFAKVDTGTPAIVDLTQVTLTGDITANGTTSSGNIPTTLSNTGVTAGTYGGTSGSSTNVGVFTVDAKGRITSASNVAISTASLSNGTSNLQIYNNGNIALSVAGISNVALFTADGANITANLAVTGNISTGGILTDNYFYANGSPVDFQQAAGSNTQVQFNNNNDFGASSNFTFNSATNVLTVTGNIGTGNITASGTTVVTGNVTGGNLSTAGQVTATGNVTGGNLVTAGDVTTNTVTATGNIVAGNISTTGSNGNITGANVISAVTFTATGNISAANLVSTGLVSATGNVTGGNVIGSALVQGTTVTATGNINGGNAVITGDVGSATVTATGNVSGGNLVTAGLVSAGTTITATGNITGGNITTTGAASVGSLTASSTATVTGNITGGNILTAGVVSATGNITGGNVVTAGQVAATGNITGGNLVTAGNVNGGNINSTKFASSTNLEIVAAGGNITFSASGGRIDMGALEVHNVATPTDATDAATKQYVDDAVSAGLTIHTPVRVESPDSAGSLNATYAQGGSVYTVNQTIAGNTVVFTSAANLQANDQLWFTSSFNGVVANVAYFVVSAPNTSSAVLSTTYNGVPVANITSGTGLSQSVRVNSGQGATLTNAGTNAALSIDGVTVNTNDRVLIYNQTNAYENGVYVVTVPGDAGNAWVLTRASDMNTYIPDNINGVDAGDYFFVQAGNSGAGESYVMTAPEGPFILGYNGLTFTQFSASQVYSANTNAGLSLTGTTFAAKVDNDTVAFAVGGNIKVKDGANLVTPNIGNATGNSLTLTGNGAVNVVTVTASGNIVGGNVTTAGIASVGSLASSTTITATGNITGGNVLTGGAITATGNITGGNISTAGTFQTASLTATGNITGGNLLTAGLINATGNVTGGNLVTAGLVSAGTTITATGNITGGNVTTAGLINATGNITGGNLVTAGVAAVTGNITGGNLITSGVADVGSLTASTTITATGNITGGNLTTAGLASVTGNITGGNLITAGVVSATGNVTGGNIDTAGTIVAVGNITGGNLSGTNIVGTLLTAAQPNITSLGNLAVANIGTATISTLANITATTAATSTTTGALRVAGGVGVVGNIYATDIYKGGVTVLNANDTIDGGTY